MKTPAEMLQQIWEKSSEDEQFRQAVLANPKATISNEFGISLPDSLTIKVHEGDGQTVHLALPPNANLNEEQLEAVAGGTITAACW